MNTTFHIVLAIVLVMLLFLLTDPFMYWMPESAAMFSLLASATLVAVFAGFVARENGDDERDVAHRALAGRMGYLAGLAILTIALLAEGLAHTLDIWVPLALAGMVVAKIAARIYADWRC
jgi:signal transduction histidine kinase